MACFGIFWAHSSPFPMTCLAWPCLRCLFRHVIVVESQLGTVCGDLLQTGIAECVQHPSIESIQIPVVRMEFDIQIGEHWSRDHGHLVFRVFFVLGQVGAVHGQNIQLPMGDRRQHFSVDTVHASTAAVERASDIGFPWHSLRSSRLLGYSLHL